MGTIFAKAQIQPTVTTIQGSKIYFDAPCKYCRDGRRATTNIRPVDGIGRPMADLNVCDAPRYQRRFAAHSAPYRGTA
jgi:hypothetical protein